MRGLWRVEPALETSRMDEERQRQELGVPRKVCHGVTVAFEADCFSRIDVMGQQQRNPSQKLQVFMSAGSVPRALPVVVC